MSLLGGTVRAEECRQIEILNPGRRASATEVIRTGTTSFMQTRPARGKPGPKGKGERTATPVYLPNDLRAEALKIAQRDGLPLTSVITRMVAESLGRPAPSYCYPVPSDQEELPLTQAS